MQKFPEEITMETLAEALRAFAAVVGFDVMAGYFPLHVDHDRITFPAVIEASDLSGEFIGEGYPEHGELSVMIEIKVGR